MKYLYKYPESVFPYDDLIQTISSAAAAKWSMSCWTRVVEYAKNTPEGILIRVSVCNRGPETAALSMFCRLCGFAILGHGIRIG
jgi:hypothetical protein